MTLTLKSVKEFRSDLVLNEYLLTVRMKYKKRRKDSGFLRVFIIVVFAELFLCMIVWKLTEILNAIINQNYKIYVKDYEFML